MGDGGGGRFVICYLSAGTYEPYRPDSDQFPEDVIGEPLEGFPDELGPQLEHCPT